MLAIYRFLFPLKPDGAAISLLLLALRILFGGLLLTHGLQKLTNYAEMSAVFPDPLGVGSNVSLGLAIFGELVCSMGFILGALYRLAMIPMLFTMCMAFFVIHGNDAFAVKELAFIYLMVFIFMYITGPGKFSVDRIISVSISKK
ncbi:DoxX family protein [Parabacteroides bouchesdurhonensis]|uniref:DoxX family protein n=1 Tax=Parabacteroides bouchesdurhonensis TaxID=1936995 RepID=UPI000C82F43F|nr:DoxX family protein [Parabacteroides bouchesdurhonensis]RHJ93417.1 DoxX family protein [Bacteroides sp. AM07-16]